jgi:alpha-galactosidase/6-phospho-beta-glucosidase family protein
MIISLDNDKLKRLALYAIWIAVIIASSLAAHKYFGGERQPSYAIVKVSELIKAEQARLTAENFALYRQTQNQDIELAAQAYYEKIKKIANAIAKAENLIIFDEGAIIGLPPDKAIDITPFIRRELQSQSSPQSPE